MSALQIAFVRLAGKKVAAYHDWTCCSTCGHAACSDDRKPGYRGYAFYHGQSTSMALDSSELYVGFDAYNGRRRSRVAVGRAIASTAEACGLKVEWGGDPDTCVKLRLARDDVDFLQGMVDEQMEDLQTMDAQAHRLQRLFFTWRLTVFRHKVAARRIARAVEEWSLRPDRPLARAAVKRCREGLRETGVREV